MKIRVNVKLKGISGGYLLDKGKKAESLIKDIIIKMGKGST